MTRIEPLPAAAQHQNPLVKRNHASEKETSAFQAVLEERSKAAHLSDRQFLSTLTAQQLSDLFAYHGLAHPVQVHELSGEGAANLLLAPEFQRDWDGDGLVEVGAAKLFVFPSPDAPQAVFDAWAELTEQERFMIQTKAFSKWLLQNWEAIAAGDEDSFTGIYHGPNTDYEKLIDELLEALQRQRKYLTVEEYRELWDTLYKFKEALRRHLELLPIK